MIRYVLLILLYAHNASALDAVVTVLETPLLKEKNINSKVVQYLRKGDIIKVHPSLANDKSIDVHAPTPEKIAAIQKKIKERGQWDEDPLFKDQKDSTHNLEDEFIPTLDRQGNQVYVMSSHVFVYLENSAESSQSVIEVDPTDYRLQEPLPKKYPFFHKTGYRGQFLLGITQPYSESYPYNESAATKSYSSPLDLNISMYKQAPGHTDDRLYFGGVFNFKYFKNSYRFSGTRESTETGMKFGVGPSVSYDAFKGLKDRINLSGNLVFNFFNQLKINQKNTTISDTRTYQTYTLSPKISVQYHRKEVVEEFDLVIGTSVELETPTIYRAQDAATQASLWEDAGDDRFTTRTTLSLGGFIGFQTAY